MSREYIKDPGEYFVRAAIRAIQYYVADGMSPFEALQKAGVETAGEAAGDAVAQFIVEISKALRGE
jgi:hypothetical protein